jgi:pyrroline-5-carboxylate reductase
MNITFIGGGNMARAIIGGLVKKGFAPASIDVVEVVPQARERLQHDLGVRCYGSPAEARPYGELVVMAVKPQQMHAAAAQVAPALAGQLVVSIAAGTRITDVSRWLGGHRLIVRCMPNTPALIGAGVTAACAAPEVSAAQRAQAARVLEAVGTVLWVEEEALLDPVTAVSGSGPAYVFYFLEGLERAGVEMGLAPEAARALALGTFAGAAKLARERGEDPAVLRAQVTSRGGTTERALAQMEGAALEARFVEAVKAARERSRELGEQFGKD